MGAMAEELRKVGLLPMLSERRLRDMEEDDKAREKSKIEALLIDIEDKDKEKRPKTQTPRH